MLNLIVLNEYTTSDLKLHAKSQNQLIIIIQNLQFALTSMESKILGKFANKAIKEYLHFSKTSLDEPLDVHLCSYFHEQHCVTRRDITQI